MSEREKSKKCTSSSCYEKWTKKQLHRMNVRVNHIERKDSLYCLFRREKRVKQDSLDEISLINLPSSKRRKRLNDRGDSTS